MKKMLKRELLDRLSGYGYALFQPVDPGPPEELLAGLLAQDDVRLLEGFPVVLASVMRRTQMLAWEQPAWQPKHDLSQKQQGRLVYLFAFSYLLFKLFGLPDGFQNRVMRLLGKFKKGKATLKEVQDSFMTSKSVKVEGDTFSVSRLTDHFRNYAVSGMNEREVEEKRHVLELELLLSELFTAQQKSLLKKKLAGKTFNKTEREYYSRVVKKRLKALANHELHQMAEDLLRR